MTFYVYARRAGQPSRLLAGPVATLENARALIEPARALGLMRHYVSPHSDMVYAGPAGPTTVGRFGLLNHLLGLPTRPTLTLVEA